MRYFYSLFFILLFTCSVNASHITGGEIILKQIGLNSYQAEVTLYRSCGWLSSAFGDSIQLGIYERGTLIPVLFPYITLVNEKEVEWTSTACTKPSNICGKRGLYKGIFSVPVNLSGYIVMAEGCCREGGINNIKNSATEGIVIYSEIPSPLVVNSTPAFIRPSLIYACPNDSLQYNFSATDIDGDSLIYSLVTPLAGVSNGFTNWFNPSAPPYAAAVWETGYNLLNVSNSNYPLKIDSLSGILYGSFTSSGNYAVAIMVKEIRNGIVISSTIKEIEVIVPTSCSPNYIPNGNNLPAGKTFTINATDKLCVEFEVSDKNNDSIFIHFESATLPGGTINAPFAFAPKVNGKTNAKASYCWQTTCEHISQTPYAVNYFISDNGCPFPKTNNNFFTIIVNPAPLVSPANMVCYAKLNNNNIEINWRDTANQKYFSYYLLYRGINGNNFLVIDTIFDRNMQSYSDTLAYGCDTINYFYFITSVNVCELEGNSSDTISADFLDMVFESYLKTISVEEENKIMIDWEDVADSYFSTYYLYRKDRNNNELTLFKTLTQYNEGFYVDEETNTADNSYCYALEIKNACGVTTPKSNISCSVMLTGDDDNSQVLFYNKINWQEYINWQGNVKEYQLLRKHNRESDFTLFNTFNKNKLSYTDSTLNIEGGEFTYLIIAIEDSMGRGAISRSNQLILKQNATAYIPNAFTPDNDGINDIWKPEWAYVKNYKLEIFNRWGEKVFTTENPFEGWNGTSQNNECAAGVYVYYLYHTEFNTDKVFIKTGNFTLIK
jgi:gliding motility-associated-like protein